MNSLVGINEIAARIEKQIRVSEDDAPEAVLAEIKQICLFAENNKEERRR